jgi:hypothetical protein
VVSEGDFIALKALRQSVNGSATQTRTERTVRRTGAFVFPDDLCVSGFLDMQFQAQFSNSSAQGFTPEGRESRMDCSWDKGEFNRSFAL